MAHFAEGFGFDLADTFAGHFELAADFLQSARVAVDQAEALFEDAALAIGETFEHVFDFVLEQDDRGAVGRVFGRFVLDEVSEARVVAVADRHLEGNGGLRHLEDRANALDGKLDLVGDLVGRGFASVFLHQLFLHADEFVDRLDHVHRDADGAGLVGDRAGDGLADPPCGVGGEFVAAAVFEFFHRFHQAHVSFLDEVEEREAAVGVFLGNGDDQPQVGLDHFGLGLVRGAVPLAEVPVGLFEVVRHHPGPERQFLDPFGQFLGFFLGFGAAFGARVVLGMLAAEVEKGAVGVFRGLDEVVGDFLFVEKLGVVGPEVGDGFFEAF